VRRQNDEHPSEVASGPGFSAEWRSVAVAVAGPGVGPQDVGVGNVVGYGALTRTPPGPKELHGAGICP
jgi:hypothetical protein